MIGEGEPLEIVEKKYGIRLGKTDGVVVGCNEDIKLGIYDSEVRGTTIGAAYVSSSERTEFGLGIG